MQVLDAGVVGAHAFAPPNNCAETSSHLGREPRRTGPRGVAVDPVSRASLCVQKNKKKPARSRPSADPIRQYNSRARGSRKTNRGVLTRPRPG